MALSALARLEGVRPPSAGTRSVRGGDVARPAERLPPGRYRVLFRTAPLAILLCDRQGRIVDANAAAIQLSGWSKEALRRTTLHALVAAGGAAPQPAASGGPGEIAWEGVLHANDGSRREVHVLEGRALGGEGGPHPVFVRDVDAHPGGEVPRGEAPPEAMLAGDDTARRLAAGAAHELSNLTAVLLGYAEILRGFVREGEEGPRYLDEVVKAAEDVVSLSQAFGTYGAGPSSRPRKLVDLGVLVRGAEGRIRSRLGHGIVLVTDFGEGGAPVLVDPAPIERAVLGLTRSAIRAMRSRGKLGIAIYGRAAKGVVVLEITDTGAALATPAPASVCAPFAVIRQDGAGGDMALAVARAVVEAHGGTLEVADREEGGVAVRMVFPAARS